MIIGVVIPCRNEVKQIAECINAIYASEFSAEVNLKVAVVDGLSDDGTIEVIEQLQKQYGGLQLVPNEKKLTPYAFNLGIYALEGCDFYQIVGARQIIAKDYLAKGIAFLQEYKDTWCIGGNVENVFLNDTGKTIAKAMATSFGMGLGNFRTLEKSAYVDTVGTPMYPNWVFEKIGYFDEVLVRNQDDDYNYRVTKAGGKIYFHADMHTKYYVRGSFQGLWRQFFQYGYWKVFVNKKHKAVTTFRQLIPPLFVLYLVLFPLFYLCSSKLGMLASIPLVLYIVLAKLVAWKNRSSFAEYLALLKTFPILHVSYGLGYLKGIFHFLLLNRQPSKKEQRLSR